MRLLRAACRRVSKSWSSESLISQEQQYPTRVTVVGTRRYFLDEVQVWVSFRFIRLRKEGLSWRGRGRGSLCSVSATEQSVTFELLIDLILLQTGGLVEQYCAVVASFWLEFGERNLRGNSDLNLAAFSLNGQPGNRHLCCNNITDSIRLFSCPTLEVSSSDIWPPAARARP